MYSQYISDVSLVFLCTYIFDTMVFEADSRPTIVWVTLIYIPAKCASSFISGRHENPGDCVTIAFNFERISKPKLAVLIISKFIPYKPEHWPKWTTKSISNKISKYLTDMSEKSTGAMVHVILSTVKMRNCVHWKYDLISMVGY